MKIFNSPKKNGPSLDFLKQYSNSPGKINIIPQPNRFLVTAILLGILILIAVAFFFIQRINQKFVDLESSLAGQIAPTIEVATTEETESTPDNNCNSSGDSQTSSETDISATYRLNVIPAVVPDETSGNIILTLFLSDEKENPISYDLQITNNSTEIGEVIEGAVVKTDDSGQAILTIKPLKSGFLNITITVDKMDYHLIYGIQGEKVSEGISWDPKNIPLLSTLDDKSPYFSELYTLPGDKKLFFDLEKTIALTTLQKIEVLKIKSDINLNLVQVVIDVVAKRVALEGTFADHGDGSIKAGMQVRDATSTDTRILQANNKNFPIIFLQNLDSSGYYLIRIIAYVEGTDLQK